MPITSLLMPNVCAFSDIGSYSKLDARGASQPMAVRMEQPPSYDHLARTGAIRSIPDDMESCPPSSYDQLDRTASWGRKGLIDEAGYNIIDRSKGSSFSNNYDHLDRVIADQGSVVSFFWFV